MAGVAGRSGRHSEADRRELRRKIKADKIIDMLLDVVSGKLKNVDPNRVTAATVLLRKVLPDLAALDATLEMENRNAVISDQPLSEAEFDAKYCAPLHELNNDDKPKH